MLGKRLGPALSLAAMVLYQGLQSDAGRSVDQQTVGGRSMRDGGSELMGAASATMARGPGGVPGASVRKGTMGGSVSVSVLSSKKRAAAKKRRMIIGIAIAAAIVILIVIVVGVVLYKKSKAPKPKAGDGSSKDTDKDKEKITDGEKEKKPKTEETTIDGKQGVKSGKRVGTGKGASKKTDSKSGGGSKEVVDTTKDPKVIGPTSTHDGKTETSSEKDCKGLGKRYDVPARDADIMIEFWLPEGSNPTPGIKGTDDQIRASIKNAIEFIIREGGSTDDLKNFLEGVKTRNPTIHAQLKDKDLSEVHGWLQNLRLPGEETLMPTSAGVDAAKQCLAPAVKEGVRLGIVDALKDLKLPAKSVTISEVNALDGRYRVDNEELKKNIAYITQKCRQTEYSTEAERDSEKVEFEHMKESVQLSAGKIRNMHQALHAIKAKDLAALSSCDAGLLQEAKTNLAEAVADNEVRLNTLQVMYGLPTKGGDGKVHVGPSALRDLVSFCHQDSVVVRQAQDYVFTFARNEAYGRVIEAIGNAAAFTETVTKMRKNEHFGEKPIPKSLMADGDALAGWMGRRVFARGTGDGIGRDSD